MSSTFERRIERLEHAMRRKPALDFETCLRSRNLSDDQLRRLTVLLHAEQDGLLSDDDRRELAGWMANLSDAK